MLKKCVLSLLNRLYTLFNNYFYVTPVFKDDDKSCIRYFRTISIIDPIWIILEAIIAGKTSEDIYSCIMDLSKVGFVNYVHNNLECVRRINVIYLYLSKSLNSVNHKRPFEKYSFLRIQAIALKCIKSYLFHHYVIIRVNAAL